MNIRQELRTHIRRNIIQRVQEEREGIQHTIRYLENRLENTYIIHNRNYLKTLLKDYNTDLEYHTQKLENLLIHTPQQPENILLI